jgi:hypothetical protein
VIPHTDVRRWQQFAEHGVLDRRRRLLQRTDALTAGYSDEGIAADVAAASADVRATG